MPYCSSCGKKLGPGEVHYGADGKPYCATCVLTESTVPCWKCGIRLPITEMRYYKGQYYCQYCFMNEMMEEREAEDKELEKCYEIIKEILNKNELEVSELTLLASFRYALGRQSYIVSEVVENVLKNWIYLSKKFKAKIKEEIEEAVKNNNAGSYTDVEQWSRILKQQDVLNCAVK